MITIFLVILVFIIPLSAMGLNESVEQVKTINTQIHNLISYGVGLPGSESAQELLAYGEGHCGDYSYLMIRELRKQGYIARIVGVRSSYKNAAHSRVEVRINGKWYLFDPTNNVYFPNSTLELVDNPSLVRNMVGTPKVRTAYNDIEFFNNPQYIECIYDTDSRDKNLVIGSTITSNTSFTSGYGLDKLADNSDITFAASQTYSFPQSFTIDFSQPKDIYRIKIKWYLPEISGKSFLIEYLDENNQYQELIRENDYVDKENDGVYEHVFRNDIHTSKIRFTLIESYGQSRILIREFKIFQ